MPLRSGLFGSPVTNPSAAPLASSITTAKDYVERHHARLLNDDVRGSLPQAFIARCAEEIVTLPGSGTKVLATNRDPHFRVGADLSVKIVQSDRNGPRHTELVAKDRSFKMLAYGCRPITDEGSG
jgi:hypothetical protein